MHDEEIIRNHRTLHRMEVMVMSLISVWTLLAIANQAYDLFVWLSLTDCTFG